MKTDLRKERELALYEAALHLIEQGNDPRTMKVQQIAEAAGIGKGTVYEYFASKDEILRGMALHCFDTEIERITGIFDACQTLADLENGVRDYLLDLVRTRMGVYRVIAGGAAGSELCSGTGKDSRVQALRELVSRTITRLQATGQVSPGVEPAFCSFVLLSTAAGGLLCLSADSDAEASAQYVCRLMHSVFAG